MKNSRRILIGFLLPAGLATAATPATRRPNILFIVGDDMGYADVGFHEARWRQPAALPRRGAAGGSARRAVLAARRADGDPRGDYKLVRHDLNAETLTGRGGQPVSAAKWYHVAIDIGEARDLAAAQPQMARALQANWDAWNATWKPPRWGGGAGRGGEAADAKESRQKEKARE